MGTRAETTKKEKAILKFIETQVLENGYPPSVREIGKAIGLSSTATVHAYLEKLEKDGYIKKEDKKGRTLKVIKGTDGQQIIKENKKDINTYITKKAKIAGEKSPAGSYLKKLIDERSKYENELNSGAEYVTSPESGVVSYKVDGYENILTTANFNYLNKDFLKSLKLKVGQVIATSQESGKIIDNFKCYIACVLNSNESKQAKIRRRVKIKTTKWKRS